MPAKGPRDRGKGRAGGGTLLDTTVVLYTGTRYASHRELLLVENQLYLADTVDERRT